MPEQHYRVERLGRHHDAARATFSSGVEALDRYFRQQAGQDLRRRLAVPYVLLEATTAAIAGFYTLSSLSVIPASLPSETTRGLARYPALPAILIGRLAVDQRFQGQGIGELLLLDALRRSLEASQGIGATAVIVDAKDNRARAFYERYGFQRFVDHEYRLFLPMSAVAQLRFPISGG